MSKYCQNPRESSFSSSQYSNHYYNNYILSDDNNIDGTTPIRSSSSSSLSSTVERSCCHPSNILGSKLGLGLFSNQQQCFVHLQSLFAKKNKSIIGVLRNRFMATPTREFLPSENSRKKKLVSGHQIKREELEREVSVLQNMLNHEEKVHQVLEHVHNQRNGSIPIPNFLPPKTKDLLAELAMVEGEITKLEGQISQLKLGLIKEQESAKESNAKQWRFGSPIRSVCNPSSFTFPSPINNNNNNVTSAQNDKIAIGYETKSMHFISKAMKGDYNLNEFSVSERRGNSKALFSDHQKENVLPRKSGLLKSVSPLRDPRTPTPRPMRNNPGTNSDTPPKPMSTLHLEETVQSWQPNKLSEEIVKCLNFIYIRLLRTTRAMELEKSGPVARTLHPSLNSRSFRSEAAGSNSSKELRQRDPYGIFNDEDSISRDIGPYKNLVIFAASSMDPKSISSPSFVPLLRKLRLLMSNLQTVELRSLTYQHKLAFWINIYNACIMNAFIQYGVPSTPDKLLTLMNKAILNIGGNIINAQAIEHYILRPSSMKETNKNNCERDNKEAVVRDLYGLETTEPNVAFALCCGARSSPAVRVYTADNVGTELERSKVEYLQASVMVTSTKRIALPELLLRNTLDFAADKELMVEWVCHQLPTSGSLRKSIMDCFRISHTTSGRIISTTTVDKIPYDYEFQYLLAAI